LGELFHVVNGNLLIASFRFPGNQDQRPM
jgi:hypothetical protein